MSERLLVVGLDGVDWRTLGPMIDRGEAPNLARLCDEGSAAPLRSVLPAVTAAAWTAFATGLDPGATGVFNFRALDFTRPGAYHPRLVDSRDLRGSTWIERLPPDSVSCVGLPMTHPPFPIPGVMLSGFPRPRLEHMPLWPGSWSSRLPPWPAAEPGDAAPRGSLVETCELWDRYHGEVALSLLRQRDDLLTVCVLSGVDHVSHRMWEGEDGGPAVGRMVRLADHLVGRLRDAAGPDTDLVVLSDHGFGPAPASRFHAGRWLALQGWLKLVPDARARWAGRLARSARSRIPEGRWRSLRDAVPSELRDRLFDASGGVDRMDPHLTRAWPVVVAPDFLAIQLLDPDPRARAQLADVLTEALERETLRLPADLGGGEGAPRVHRRGELYGGRRLGSLPELFASLPPGWCWGGATDEGPVVDAVPDADLRKLPGAHRRDGVLLAAGPRFRRLGRADGQARPPALLDVAPTVCALLGIPVNDGARGRRLDTWLHSDASTGVRPRSAVAPAPATATPSPGEEEVADLTRRLRDLGYLE